ncbi:relaxase/mobilization nuclease domain-containing protein [Rhizobium tumorigenes]|uniref:Conjugal transfer protein TraA n=1 Tax=Rhizobium tumorigenes TaxID=2041385 RepID=A0AAF1KWS3_9HYPH|nr:conjugal transfer protein TraA [Rhizobium tumorigenes]WFR97794.1 conjugal transfer protein TraA [Rhizobium tumorigenes]
MELFFGAFTTEWERKRAAFLHDLSLGKRKPVDDEGRRRRSASVVATGPNGLPFSRRRTAGLGPSGVGIGSSARTMKMRLTEVAAGSQPAVVKMASYGGGSRFGAMVNYIARNGEVELENERGEKLHGRHALASIAAEWDHLMKNRAESRDIASFRIAVETRVDEGDRHHALGRKIIKWAVGDRSFAFAVSPRTDGSGYDVEGLVVLRSPGGERLTGDAKASRIVQLRMEEARQLKRGGAGIPEAVRFQFTGYGNGTDYGTRRLRTLVEKHGGRVEEDTGKAVADAKAAGDLVQKVWREQLHGRKPRDVMHLILSARPGTDIAAFHSASREFLSAQFDGHRYVFSIHDPVKDPKPEQAGGKRPHVHVHAIVAMRSDFGDRIETTIQSFRRWREGMAEKAREQGIRMEMTDRRERAAAAAYRRGQVRPISTLGRTQHEGTSEAAQGRYDAKCGDARAFARSEQSRSYMHAARRAWAEVAEKGGSDTVVSFAKAQLLRLGEQEMSGERRVAHAGPSDHPRSQARTDLVTLMTIVSEGDEMRQMSRSEFESYEKRVETALFHAERIAPADQFPDFDEIARAARAHVNVHRELMELREQEIGRGVRREPDRQHQHQHQDRGDENKAWDEAVSRHGLQAVEAANKIMLDVEYARERIERADAGEIKADRQSLRLNLEAEMARAGELGAAGNGLIREIAQVDGELRIAIEAAERSRERSATHRQSDDGPIPSQAHSKDSLVGERQNPAGGRQEVEGQAENKHHALREERVSPAPGDTTRADPAKPVPRLEALQREVDERKERYLDDGER